MKSNPTPLTQSLPDRTCPWCDTQFTPRTGNQKYCQPQCSEKTRNSRRRGTCSVCGEPMWRGRTSASPDKARHQRCSGRDTDGNIVHGIQAYRRHRCRCDVCRAANTAEARAWQVKTDYWSRPDVVERRRKQRSTAEAKAADSQRWSKYYTANRDAMIVHAKVKEVRRKGAPTIPFTPEQLEARLSMYSGCWMCGTPTGTDRHIDHVKPLSRGGWHCLSNLRPSCQRCNLSKGSKWPIDTANTVTTNNRTQKQTHKEANT